MFSFEVVSSVTLTSVYISLGLTPPPCKQCAGNPFSIEERNVTKVKEQHTYKYDGDIFVFP